MTHTASYDKAKSIDPLEGLLRVELVKSMAFRFKSIATMEERKRERRNKKVTATLTGHGEEAPQELCV